MQKGQALAADGASLPFAGDEVAPAEQGSVGGKGGTKRAEPGMVQGSRGPTLGSGGTDGEKAEGDTRRFTGRTSGSSFPDTREEPRAASLGRWSQRHPEPRQDQVGGTLSWGRGSLHVQCAKRKRPETKRRRLGGTGDPPKLEPPEERGPVLAQEKRGPRTQTAGAAVSKGSQEEPVCAARRGRDGRQSPGRDDLPETDEDRRHRQTRRRSREARGLTTGQGLRSRRVPSDS